MSKHPELDEVFFNEQFQKLPLLKLWNCKANCLIQTIKQHT